MLPWNLATAPPPCLGLQESSSEGGGGDGFPSVIAVAPVKRAELQKGRCKPGLSVLPPLSWAAFVQDCRSFRIKSHVHERAKMYVNSAKISLP